MPNFKVFQFRLTKDEQIRYEEVFNRAQAKSPLVELDLSKVSRRLAGILPPDELVTEDDIEYFRGTDEKRILKLKDFGAVSPADEDSVKSKSKSPKKVVNGD
ncbi:MAG: hypothetical protein INR69_22035 [Mucilaginibacter polytrichastri]|nr:hypothetical protein [Mucilaginibacter polytrichastri]